MQLQLILEDKSIYQLIYDGIINGNSRLKIPLLNNIININLIMKCIKSQRCLDLGDIDVGSTYLEQIISRIINDKIPINDINKARKQFGLELLDRDQLLNIIKDRKKN